MPRTKEQNKKILDQRKKEIIVCAITIFSDKDYKSVTVDDITNKLKISHGLFYHYFKNKTDLIKTIVSYAEDTIMTDFRKIAEKYSGTDLLYQHFALVLRNLKQKETCLLMNFLNNIVKDTFETAVSGEKSILEKFYSSAIYKCVKNLSYEGKLIQSIETTFRMLLIITNGLCALAKEGKLSKINISAKNIIKAVAITTEESEEN